MGRILGLPAAVTAAILLTLVPVAARTEQGQPIITALPDGAVTIQSCDWKAKSTAFDADIRINDHTNLPVVKTRLLLTFVDRAGESVQAYADMVGRSVALAPGLPMNGRWTHGAFPLSMKNMRCAIVGVKFLGYPNVIFATVK